MNLRVMPIPGVKLVELTASGDGLPLGQIRALSARIDRPNVLILCSSNKLFVRSDRNRASHFRRGSINLNSVDQGLLRPRIWAPNALHPIANDY